MLRLNLSTKITLLVASLLLGLGLVMLATFAILSARQINRTIEADGVTAGKQLSLFLSERSSDLRRQAHWAATGVPRIEGLIKTGDPATVQEEIPWLSKQFSVQAFQILNQDGAVMGQSPELASLGPSTKAFVNATVASASERTSVVQSGSSIYLVSCAPVFSGQYLRGAITLFQKLGAHEARLLGRESGDKLGFTVDGRLIASSASAPFTPPSDADGPRQLSLDGEPYVAISQKLPAADPKERLGFVVLRPTASITAPYEEARTAFVSVLLISLILSLAGGVAFGRGIVKPIASLAAAARVIQGGEWPSAFSVTRQDEIGILQASFNDMIVASRTAQERLLAMIDLDPLTELSNHRTFRERLNQEAQRCEASGDTLGLALLDLDAFDHLNEMLGHGAGDHTLIQIAEALRESVPEFGLVARYSGDKFAVALPGSHAAGISELIASVQALLKERRCPVTVSVGCSEYPKNSSKSEGLVLASELALARAKQLGKDRICSFDTVPGADGAADPFQLYQSLEDGSFATIQALAAAVDAKDAYTNGHSERVASYACSLSAALGDSPEMVDRIFRCGTLHDVGKIGVPDAILKKPGRLEPEEQRVMETHAVLGELIAGKVPQLADLLPGVRNHHERWDGKGYPDGLTGEAIPYIARVLAVADTYDAMTSDRPYRKGLGQEIALAEIEKMAGTQFEPRLALMFVRVMREQDEKQAA